MFIKYSLTKIIYSLTKIPVVYFYSILILDLHERIRIFDSVLIREKTGKRKSRILVFWNILESTRSKFREYNIDCQIFEAGEQGIKILFASSGGDKVEPRCRFIISKLTVH